MLSGGGGRRRRELALRTPNTYAGTIDLSRLSEIGAAQRPTETAGVITLSSETQGSFEGDDSAWEYTVTPEPAGPPNLYQITVRVSRNLNGKPFERLGTGVEGTAVVGTSTSAFTNPVSVIANTTYWIGVFTDQAYYAMPVNTTTTSAEYSATYSNTPPDPLNTGETNSQA